MGNAAILILPHFYGVKQGQSPFLIYKQERSHFILSTFPGASAFQNLERKGAIAFILGWGLFQFSSVCPRWMLFTGLGANSTIEFDSAVGNERSGCWVLCFNAIYGLIYGGGHETSPLPIDEQLMHVPTGAVRFSVPVRWALSHSI